MMQEKQDKISYLKELFPTTPNEILEISLQNNNNLICTECLDEIMLREAELKNCTENDDNNNDENNNNKEEKLVQELGYQFPSLTKEDIWIFLESSSTDSSEGDWRNKKMEDLVEMIREQHLLQIAKFKKPKRTQIGSPISFSIKEKKSAKSVKKIGGNNVDDLLPIILSSLSKDWLEFSGKFELILPLREEGRSLHEERIILSKKDYTSDRVREMGEKAKVLEAKAGALIFEEGNPLPIPIKNGFIVLDFHHLFVDEAFKVIDVIEEHFMTPTTTIKGLHIITGVGLHSDRTSGPRLLPKIMDYLKGKKARRIEGGGGIEWIFKK